jgi:D-glycero-D-manno-heptose 1,7-bisphosphate phosphatase
MRPAVFLDRDGVINEEVYYPEFGEWEAPMASTDLVLKSGAVDALRELQGMGYALILVSNQAAFAKGKTALRSLHEVHERFDLLMRTGSVRFTDYHYSFSHPDGTVPSFSGRSVERKPSPYLLFVAQAKHDLDLARSWLIGDRTTDIECGRAAGVRTILVTNSRAGDKAAGAEPTRRAADLREAAEFIASHHQPSAACGTRNQANSPNAASGRDK